MYNPTGLTYFFIKNATNDCKLLFFCIKDATQFFGTHSLYDKDFTCYSSFFLQQSCISILYRPAKLGLVKNNNIIIGNEPERENYGSNKEKRKRIGN